MNEMSDSQRIAYQTRIFDLSENCPFDGSSPCTCPWHEIRNKSANERWEWVRALSDESLNSMLAFHKLCSERPIETFTDRA